LVKRHQVVASWQQAIESGVPIPISSLFLHRPGASIRREGRSGGLAGPPATVRTRVRPAPKSL